MVQLDMSEDLQADYELCCQISSQQPQAVLCRADTPCDLVVSLRSLRFERTVETVLISLDADASLWIIEDRQKCNITIVVIS